MEDKTHLNPADVSAALAKLPGWRQEGVFLAKDYVFGNFQEINRFLPYFAQAIVAQNHHPDFEFVGGEKRVSLRTTTHSEGCLTQADLDLANALEKWQEATA